MQIVAALAKVFSLRFKRRNKKEELFIIHYSLSSLTTIWWHHHVPWYFQPLVENTKEEIKNKKEERRNFFKSPQLFIIHYSLFITKFLKGFFEKNFVVPHIDQMIATSHFVAQKIREYCGRDSVVVHPVIARRYDKAIHDSISESMSQTDTWIPAVADAPSE